MRTATGFDTRLLMPYPPVPRWHFEWLTSSILSSQDTEIQNLPPFSTRSQRSLFDEHSTFACIFSVTHCPGAISLKDSGFFAAPKSCVPPRSYPICFQPRGFSWSEIRTSMLTESRSSLSCAVGSKGFGSICQGILTVLVNVFRR